MKEDGRQDARCDQIGPHRISQVRSLTAKRGPVSVPRGHLDQRPAPRSRRSSSCHSPDTLAAVCYLISSLAPVVGWIRPLRFASLFCWAVGDQQLLRSAEPSAFAVLLTVAIIAAIAADAAFRRLGIR